MTDADWWFSGRTGTLPLCEQAKAWAMTVMTDHFHFKLPARQIAEVLTKVGGGSPEERVVQKWPKQVPKGKYGCLRGDKHVFENSYLQLETAWPASFQFQVRFLAQDPQGNGPKIRVQTIQLVTTCHFLTWTCGYYPPRPPPRVGDGGGEAVSS